MRRSIVQCAATALALSGGDACAFAFAPASRTIRVTPGSTASLLRGFHREDRPRRAATAMLATPTSSVAGKIFPFLSKFLLTPAKCRSIVATLTDTKVDPGEFVLMAAIGWGLVPAMRYFCARKLGLDRDEDGVDASSQAATGDGKPFEETWAYLVAKLAGQASKIGCAVYAVDCLALALSAMGFKFLQRYTVSAYVARVAYAVWFTLRVRDFKHSLLEKYALKKSKHREGKIKVYDRLINAVLFFAAGMGILDIINVSMGRAAASLLSLGGIGTLVLSLASKDLAEQLVSGLSVSTSDRFYEGDKIQLGDGTRGVVTKIGWTHTEMRNSDQTVTSIPNSKIFNQRVTNLSRVYKCQVKQTLWFSYDDLEKMDEVCGAIVDEIRRACPEVIHGRVRAHWREYASDHLEVVVDAHFSIPPVGLRYLNNKQRVLNVIGRAVKNCGVDFSLPTQMEITRGMVQPVQQHDAPSAEIES